MSDLIRRDDAIRELSGACSNWEDDAKVQEIVKALPSADAVEYESTVTLNSPISISAEAVQGWIPCSERLPEDIRPVLVTWKNIDPASYYQYIVGKHFIGTAHYYRGKWYWYSSTTEDMLAEYGRYDFEEFDEAIECIAWMPLPKPYKGGDSE